METQQYRLEWPRPAKGRVGPEWLRDDNDTGGPRRWQRGSRLLIWGELGRAHSSTYDIRPYLPFESLAVLPALVRVDRARRDRRPPPKPGETWTPPSHQDDPVIKAVATFVEDFGLLGQSDLGAKLAVVRVDGTSGRHYPAPADDLTWFLDHANTVHLALQIIDSLRGRATRDRRRRLVSLVPERIPTVQAPWWTTVDNLDDIRNLNTLDDPGPPARHALAALLTPNLAGVPLVLDPESGTPVFQFRALVQAVYWMLADHWGIGRRPRRCKECGAIFFADDGRETFCPPPPGVKESRCGRRYRMRKARR